MTWPVSGSTPPFVVSDPKQARLLTEPRSQSFFKPFLGRECSAKQAAGELDCSLSTLLYRIKTFVEVDLLQVTREERRAGRAIKMYRSVRDAYFVPFGLTPYATLEERLTVQAQPIFAALIRAYAAALQQSERFGQHLLRAGDGSVWTTDFPPEFTPTGWPLIYADQMATLDRAEAQRLTQELKALFARLPQSQKTQPQAPYFMLVALLPTTEQGNS